MIRKEKEKKSSGVKAKNWKQLFSGKCAYETLTGTEMQHNSHALEIRKFFEILQGFLSEN